MPSATPVASGEDRGLRDGVALALSGGGYRATLFHLGGLWRLNELGWLSKLTRVSSVSGGSIAAAYLGLRWKDLTFRDGVATNFADVVVTPLRRFCARTIDIPAFLIGKVTPFVRPSDMLAAAYRLWLFGGATLQDLPRDGAGPRFVLNTTSLQTGADMRFSQPYIADYKLNALYNEPRVTLARAVAASSGFPPVFSPVIVKPKGGTWERKGEPPGAGFMSRFILSDGGVYDNLGLQTVEDFKTILVSDGGGPLAPDASVKWSRVSQLLSGLRSIEACLAQNQARRKHALFSHPEYPGRQTVAYWGILPDEDEPIETMKILPTYRESLYKIRTRLNHFTDAEQGHLINWGYALADHRTRERLYDGAHEPGPGSWPVPDHALDR